MVVIGWFTVTLQEFIVLLLSDNVCVNNILLIFCYWTA